MIIHLKNKDTLVAGDFYLKCCIGKNALSSDKKEGDSTTPIGLFKLNKLYFSQDYEDCWQVIIPELADVIDSNLT